MKLLYIISFGTVGVVARYAIGTLAKAHLDSQFPLGTFGVNMVGAFLIGVVYVGAVERSVISPDLRLGLIVGFLGGFTTFSSYCLETLQLLEEGEYLYATLYLTLSPLLGLGAAFGGAFIVRKFLEGVPG